MLKIIHPQFVKPRVPTHRTVSTSVHSRISKAVLNCKNSLLRRDFTKCVCSFSSKDERAHTSWPEACICSFISKIFRCLKMLTKNQDVKPRVVLSLSMATFVANHLFCGNRSANGPVTGPVKSMMKTYHSSLDPSSCSSNSWSDL